MQKDSLYTRFLAGAIASSTAEMATLPVDITKVRLQAQGMTTSQGVQYTGMLDAVGKIAKYEGIGALWNGAQPAVARQIVYSSMCMVLYEPFRDAIMMMTQPDTTQKTMSFAQKLMAGGLAGAISISIANPVDVIKVRMQADRSGKLYSGIADAVVKINAAEGWRGFLNGLGPNVTRGFIVNAAELGVYDQCKSTLVSLGLVKEGGIGATFGSSLVAGLAGALASNPVDVVKTRLMTQSTGMYTSAHHCAYKTFKDEGLKAFYKGFFPNWMRKAPWCVVFFVTYEQAKSAIVLPTIERPAPAVATNTMNIEEDVCIEENETWDDWEEDDEAMKCFFCSFTHNQLPVIFTHAKQEHKFDFRAVASKLQLDFYGMVRLINFARSHDAATSSAIASAQALAGDELLIPVIPEDPMLCRVMDLDSDDDNDDEVEEKAPPSSTKSVEEENSLLKKQIEELRGQLAKVNSIVHALTEEEGDVKKVEKEQDNDTYYFDSYSQVGIHKEMITDKVRTDSYRDAILNNAALFKGKVVLDVGCGTGILSMFAAKAGAAKVIGIDCSDMGVTAQKIVQDNGLSDIITIIRGKVELVKLPVDHVDIIISEWMGYNLLYESMLDTVLFARDKWLAPNGLLFPDKSTMFLQGMTDSTDRLGFWKSVYGFDMTAVRNRISTSEAFVEVVDPKDILTDRVLVQSIDIPTVTLLALDFTAPFQLKVSKDGLMHGFLSSFDIGFEAKLPNPLWFSTGCEATPTHWQQTFFHVQQPFHVRVGDVIKGTWFVKRNATNPRFLDVDFTWTHGGNKFFEKFTIH